MSIPTKAVNPQRFFCTICCLQFTTLEERNVHLKSEYHIFNAKRKAVDLEPISLEKYKEIIKQQEQANVEIEVMTYHCSLCKKKYNSKQQIEEHIKSKKHKANMRKYPERAEHCISSTIVDDQSDEDDSKDISTERMEHKQEEIEIHESTLDEMIEERKKSAPTYSSHHCLFCSLESENIEKNLEHMEKEHSFFIPNIECCCDIEGLMNYLHDKICIGYMCIWCGHSKSSFKACKDVRQHMIDSCHCKMLYENDNLEEYDNYYDYSTIVHAVEIVAMDDVSMTLSNGMVIGHRSMANYYKQSIKPVTQRTVTIVNKPTMPIPQESINRFATSKELITNSDVEYIESVKEALRRQIISNSSQKVNQKIYRQWAKEGLKSSSLFKPRTFKDITAPKNK